MTKILFIPNGEYLIFCNPAEQDDITIESLWYDAFPHLYRELYVNKTPLNEFDFAQYVNKLDEFSPFRIKNKLIYDVSKEMFEVIYD
jgi:hypothetical protein